jgi:hypothetical protein
MKKVLFSGLISLFIISLQAQSLKRTCSTMEVLERLKAEDPSYAQRLQSIETQTAYYLSSHKDGNSIAAIVTIPVVFHVVYNTSAQNISDAQCIAQLNQLNLDYAKLNSDAGNTPSVFAGAAANTNIQFCLAQRTPTGTATTGIIHKSTTKTSFSTNDGVKYSAQGGDDAWPASSYLNIWSCNLGQSLLGYAQFPGGAAATDGVVLLYSSIGSMAQHGTAAPYDLGRTATHEVGHWLNCYHIWGDDGSGCTGSDNCSDTPNQGSENYGCPSFPHVSCSNGPNGDMFMNYMDYTDDACMYMFTNGQSSRMNALFTTGGARVSIVSSQGCVPPSGGGTCDAPTGLAASSITSSSATLSWNAASGAVSYNIQYRVVGNSTWTSTTSTSTSKSLTSLAASTNYEWEVQTVCSSSPSAYSSVVTFTTSAVSSCVETYESNNTSGTAASIPVNTNLTSQISTSSDIDWYKFTTTSPNTRVMITLTTLPADYDIVLYYLKNNGTLQQAGSSANASTTSETIKYNTASAHTYYIKVYGYNGAFSSSQCYTLKASTSSSNFRLGSGIEEIDEPELSSNQMILFPNPAINTFSVGYNASSESNADIHISDMTGRIILSQKVSLVEGFNKFDFNASSFSKGIYFIELVNKSGRTVQRLVLDK